MSRVLKVTYLTLSIVFLGCENVEDPLDAFESEIVVEGYLYANRPFKEIILRESLSSEEAYDYIAKPGVGERAYPKMISGAVVEVSNHIDHHILIEDSSQPGYYIVNDSSLFIIEPGETYTLRIDYDGKKLFAETVVPETLTIQKQNPETSNTLPYPGDNVAFSLFSTNNTYGYFIIIKEVPSDNPNAEQISIPYYERPDDNYFLTLDTEIILQWSYFYNYNRVTRIWVYALDQNIYDFWSTLRRSFGDTYPPIDHIDGGLGIFGSVLVDSLDVIVVNGGFR